MSEASTQGCPRCAELEKKLEELLARIALLEAELAKARKDSSNSSKPPSSDIVKPKKPEAKRTGKRKRGGQKGHRRHERRRFEPSEIDITWEYSLTECPTCRGSLRPCDAEPRIVQQVELVPRPTQVSEHRGLAYWCPTCETVHHAPIDPAVRRAGLVGPRLASLIAYLKGACHCSFTTIRKFVRDVVGVTISRGQLAKLISRASDSMERAYDELLKLLPEQQRLNVDETGHKDDGTRMWTWCFRAALFTLFKISPSRGSDVLLEVLGREFDGVLGCDYFSAYRKYMGECNVTVQFCLAHLIRDLKFLTGHSDRLTRAYGRRVLEVTQRMFGLIHRRQELHPDDFANALEDVGNELCGAAIYRVPSAAEAQNLARRFEKHGDSYIRFITTPGIEPTNNLAEQAIRFVVIDRRVTQGSRGTVGQKWLERIWTTMATCAEQGRSVFDFLHDSIRAHYHGTSPPSLVPNTS